MGKLILCFAMLMLLSLNSMAQNVNVRCKITDVDTLMVLIRSLGKSDTIITHNGQFEYKSSLLHATLFTIVCVKNNQSIQALKENNERKMRDRDDGVSRDLFLDEGEVIITSTFSGFSNANVNRSNHYTQDKYDEFRKRFNPLVKVARSVIDSSFVPGRTEQELKLCRNLLDRVNQIETEVAEKFVTENSDNAAGAYVLYRYCRIEDYGRLDSLYNLFSASLKASDYLLNIKDKLKALSTLNPGKPVTLFSAKTSNETTVGLSDFRGKYVVLDFWGTWCAPCINGFPKMKEYYQKYSGKIEFIGIACKNTEADWLRFIGNHSINWVHLLNRPGSRDLTVQYNVETYPTKILIDPDGNLIQVFTGETEDFYQKLDSIFRSQME